MSHVRCRILLLLFSFIIIPPLFAQFIEIEEASAKPEFADPGTLVTKAFFVSNSGTLQEEYTSVITLPAGWRLVALDATPLIPLKSETTVFATFYIPTGAEPGEYSMGLAIRDRATAYEMALFDFEVTVRERTGFDLQLAGAPDYVVAGEVYQSLFRLQNTGNIVVELDIGVRSDPDLDYVSEISTVALDPGGARVFAVSVRTDQSYSKRVRHMLRVTAASATGTQKNIASSVAILPRISGEDKPYRSLPVNVAIVQALRHAEADTYGFLATMGAEGSLSESGDDAFSAFVKVPIDKDGALFNEQGEFTIAYKRDPFDLFLGNSFFSVSKLTEESIYGTGAKLEYGGESFVVGGYHLETDLTPPSVSQSALWYAQEIGDTTRIKLNIVDSVSTIPPGSIDLLTGIEVHKIGGIGPNTVFEYASDAFHGHNAAYRIGINDNRSDLSYALETVRADNGFTGEVDDIEEYSARLAFPLGPSLAVNSRVSAKQSSLDSAVPALTQAVSLGARWTVTPETGITLSFVQMEDNDPVSETSLSTEGFRLILSHAIDALRISASAQIDANIDDSTAHRLLRELYSGTVSYDLSSSQKLDGFTSLSASQGHESARALTFGLNYSAELGDKTGLQLAYRSSNKTGSYYAGQDSFKASLYYRIADGQTAMLQGTYAPKRSLGRLTDFNLSLMYNASLDLPIGLRKVGKITGLVIDRETGRGVPDVILRIGDRIAVTDLSGRFLVLSLTPGEYTVGVDVSRVDVPRIVYGPQPIEVKVEARETSEVEVLLVEPGVITGTVKRFERDFDGVVTEVGGIPDLLLQVIGENRRLLVITDRNGDFRISQLTPGEWLVTIASSQLPDDTYVETDRPIINISPGEPEEVFLGVYPVLRQIKMIDEGTVLGNGSKGPESE